MKKIIIYFLATCIANYMLANDWKDNTGNKPATPRYYPRSIKQKKQPRLSPQILKQLDPYWFLQNVNTDYLPLAGGTIAGSLVINNNNAINELVFNGGDYSNILSNTTLGFQIGISNSSSSGPIGFITRNQERFRITDGGRILIGTTLPTDDGISALQVSGIVSIGSASSGTKLNILQENNYSTEFQSATGGSGVGGTRLNIHIGSAHGQFSWSNSSSELLRITQGGNVGIGTTSPSTPLHVSGGLPMHAGWNKTATLQATYPVQLFNSNNTKWAGIGYDFSTAMRFWVNSPNDDLPANANNAMTILNNGNIGIGATSPTEKLDVAGNINMSGASGRRIYMGGVGSSTFGIAYDAAHPNYGIFYTEGSPDYVSISPNGDANNGVMNVFGNGNVGIGTTTPSEKLSVNGNVRTKKLIVTQTGWPDYVFHKNYNLQPLAAVEDFIQKNKHLPGIPSAKEVEQKGLDVGDTQALLLKKIEELTLHIIAQEKRIKALEQEQAKKENKSNKKGLR